jgi:UDP-GlcNAc3NAcA epimerase
MKILTIIGARPQFIKAAAVSRAIAPTNHITEVLVHTGQHFDDDMSDIFFDQLSIAKPKYNLGIHGGTHASMTGKMLEALEIVMVNEKPDWALVYGDTNSTLAAALAAAKLHIPVAHVEAGLRSFNRNMPEEINRIMTDHISDLLFAPTKTALSNLGKEGFSATRLELVGDVMYDSALFYRNRTSMPLWFKDLGINRKEFILATIHRAENTDDPVCLGGILKGLNDVAKKIPVIFPLHPRTRKILSLGSYLTENIIFCNPVGYLEMLWLLDRCKLVVTDSGGLQKEAYFFGKSCVITRKETEWVELVDSGWNFIAGCNSKLINSLTSVEIAVQPYKNFYGNGDASRLIVDRLLK